MRVVRVLRAVRVTRVLRVMRFAEDLQLLVSCILHSFKSFLWAFLLILIKVYVFGIYLTQAVTMVRFDENTSPEAAEELKMWFGTVVRSAISLFQSLTGGVDWNDITRPLFDYVSNTLGFMTMLFIAFSILAVLNIVTGTFVSRSMERAEEVRKIHGVSQARKLFNALDEDNSGFITYTEIDEQLQSADVLEFFRTLDVDVSEAKCLFQVLDLDGSGTIEFDEFMDTCMRLQGPSRAMDLMTFVRETRACFQQQQDVLLAQQHTLVQMAQQLVELMSKTGLADGEESHRLRKAAQSLEEKSFVKLNQAHQCSCGNFLMDDSNFCRRCGKARDLEAPNISRSSCSEPAKQKRQSPLSSQPEADRPAGEGLGRSKTVGALFRNMSLS